MCMANEMCVCVLIHMYVFERILRAVKVRQLYFVQLSFRYESFFFSNKSYSYALLLPYSVKSA